MDSEVQRETEMSMLTLEKLTEKHEKKSLVPRKSGGVEWGEGGYNGMGSRTCAIQYEKIQVWYADMSSKENLNSSCATMAKHLFCLKYFSYHPGNS